MRPITSKKQKRVPNGRHNDLRNSKNRKKGSVAGQGLDFFGKCHRKPLRDTKQKCVMVKSCFLKKSLWLLCGLPRTKMDAEGANVKVRGPGKSCFGIQTQSVT